jgi:signal transduction histidine kinase
MSKIFQAIFGNRPLTIVVGGFLLTIATFIANIILSNDITSNLKTNENKVESIYSELALLSKIEGELSFAENSLKNYLVSKQSIYLRGHDRSVARLEKSIDQLVESSSGIISFELTKSLRAQILARRLIFKKSKILVQTKNETQIQLARELLSHGADKTLQIFQLLQDIESNLKVSLQINKRYIERSISYGSYTNYLAICIATIVAFFATISITQDYLRQKEIERILRQLNDDKTKLFSILGHDLRSPLSGINAVIYILKNHLAELSETELKEYIDSLEQTSLNYGKLLEDVLTWSRLQLNKVQIDIKSYELKVICQEVVDLYIDQFENKEIIVSNLVPSTQIIMMDKTMVQTVLRNLVSNSIKFTNHGGLVRINFKEDKDSYYLSVADSGVGMNSSVIRTLFTNSTISMVGTDNEVGTGLGLAICKEFLDKDGGDLRVESKEGEGSVFTIVLLKESNLKRIKAGKKNV